MHDVMRASLGEIGQNLLTKHFLASPHVYGTIEGLMLPYYDWLFDLTSVTIKFSKRLVTNIVCRLQRSVTVLWLTFFGKLFD